MGRKFTYDEANNFYKSNGCDLLETNYVNSKTQMKYKCKCGREDKKSFRAFQDVPYCTECSLDLRPKKLGKRKKLTHQEVEQLFKDGGCVLLSEVYVNSSSKLKYICECTRESTISLEKFKLGRRCKECGNERKSKTLTQPYSKVLNEFQENGYLLLTDEEDYINAQKHIYYICDNGHNGRTTYTDFKAGVRCMTCCGSEKHTLEFVRYVFEEAGCELLVDEYINAQTKMKYRCDCTNISEINYNNFSMGKRCDECAKGKRAEKHKLDIKDVRIFFEENGCTLLSTEYLNVTEPLTYICKCTEVRHSSYSTFKKSRQCKYCSFDALRNLDITDEDREDRRKIEGYREWRKTVYERDNFTCQCCKTKKGGTLNAHHLDGYHWCRERRIDVTNGVTLCVDCHTDFHSEYGNRNNTEAQYEEFLINKL